ncbi:hypothetical protein MCEMSE15_01279 [Fimbriimonadaceae bacterium]
MLLPPKSIQIICIIGPALAGCAQVRTERPNALMRADERIPDTGCTFSKTAPSGWLAREDVRCAAGAIRPIIHIHMAGSENYRVVSELPKSLEPSMVDVLSKARYRAGRRPKEGFFRQYPDKNDLKIDIFSDRYRTFAVNFETIEDDLGPEVAKWFKDNMPQLRRLATAGQPSEAELKRRRPNTFGQNFAKKLLTKNVTEITLTNHPHPNIVSIKRTAVVGRLKDPQAIKAMLVAMSKSTHTLAGEEPKNAPDRPQELSFVYKEGTETKIESFRWWGWEADTWGDEFAILFSEHFESSNR